jgi:hypothetical protein
MQVILDKMNALSDMCVTQFCVKQAVFDSIRRGPLPSLYQRALPHISPLPRYRLAPCVLTLPPSHFMQCAVRGIRCGCQSRDQDPQLKAACCPMHPQFQTHDPLPLAPRPVNAHRFSKAACAKINLEI